VSSTRNVTLVLPEELTRKAKVLAAQRRTTLSGLVSSLLTHALGDVEEYDTLWAAEEQVMAAGPLHVGPIAWTRDDLHAR
jgi:hypothetical protein